MIGVVVASLTITNPYVFKIVNNFLIWLFRCLGRLGAAWKRANTSEPPSARPGVTTSLLRPPSGNGRRSSPGEDEHLNSSVAESGSSSNDQSIQVNEARTPNGAVSNEQNIRMQGLQDGSTVNSAPGKTRQSKYGTESISDVLPHQI